MLIAFVSITPYLLPKKLGITSPIIYVIIPLASLYSDAIPWKVTMYYIITLFKKST